MAVFWSFLNFFIFLFFVWKMAKKPAGEAAQKKNEEYKRLLHDASEAYESAEKRLRTLKTRFASLEKELSQIKEQAKESAALEADKLRKEGVKISSFLAKEAERVSAVELSKAKETLRGELWEQTKEGVVKKLQKELTADKQQELVSSSIGALGTLKS